MNPYWIGILVVVVGGIVLALAIWGIKQFFQQDKSFQNQQDKILQTEFASRVASLSILLISRRLAVSCPTL